ncbi:putative porin [Pelagerythrobacter rhizovicinus]|uniref:Porin n=1 Tax=Pelagerythrobacter rhizovicinus TaxID=2268576 RepID=A0A4Q2KRL6_9SPHN|nr:putative porin [Pelagerythrobacter rhizovicinus]RXZ66313.1 hypothetical protein ETX26_06350 [Pelagerythrobacter rhizovicinus]
MARIRLTKDQTTTIPAARVNGADTNLARIEMLKTKVLLGSSAIALAMLGPTPAMAQSTDDVGVEILQLLVDEGVIPFEKAQSILDRARENAALRAETEAAAKAEDVVNVPYVPETVRDEIKNEVRNEVVQTAKEEGWVSPNTLPDWVNAVRISGDLRVRGQYDNFADGNFPSFPDANAINQLGGVTDAQGFPLLNSTVDRERVSYRARLNFEARVADGIQVGLRLASGDEPGAVSTNSTFGNYFDRNTLWVDRAFIDIEPLQGAHLVAGRMSNPFYSTSLVWDADINPEGVALAVDRKLEMGLGLFATGGLFPLSEREIYPDAYLYAGQLGASYDTGAAMFASTGIAYYLFDNVQSLKNPADGSRVNDWSAPAYLRQGNSLFNMRTDGLTTLAGLASEFELLAGTAELGYRAGPLTFKLTGEVVRNLALDRAEIVSLRGEEAGDGVTPGDLGWHARFEAGHPVISNLGEWRVAAAYRRVETDAVMDIFTDSDFGLGGTDVEGYELEGSVGIHKNTTLGLRWMSSDSINRAPFSVDILQVELNSRF